MNTMMQVVAQALYGQSEGISSTKSVQRYTVSFIEGSRLLGSTTWPQQISHEQLHIPYSVAYFCRTCGEVWRRILVHENADDWHVIHTPCRRHTTMLGHGGSFYYSWFQEDFDIPKHILAEDFLFLMTLFDKSADSYIP